MFPVLCVTNAPALIFLAANSLLGDEDGVFEVDDDVVNWAEEEEEEEEEEEQGKDTEDEEKDKDTTANEETMTEEQHPMKRLRTKRVLCCTLLSIEVRGEESDAL